MIDKEQNIDELFKKLAHHTVSPKAEEWWVINKKLKRKEFLKFNISRFNIYYSTAIALAFVMSSALVLDNYLFNKVVDEPASVVFKKDINTNIENEKEIITDKEAHTSVVDENVAEKGSAPVTRKHNKDNVHNADSCKSEASQAEKEQADKPKVIIVQKVDVVVRDTVYKYETKKKR